MKCIAWIVLGLVVLVTTAEAKAAAQEKISIDSFRILNTTPDFVDIELAGSNEGSIDQLWLGAIAKSRDGITRSGGFPPLIVPVDKQFHLVTRVQRPNGREAQKTDVLLVMVYPGGKDVILRRKFDWPYVWPKTDGPPAGTAEYTNLDTSHPWQIFYENLEEDEFAALDELMKKWNNPKERDENGEWKLDSFRSVFVNFSSGKRDWNGDMQRIKRWRAFNPKSAGAAIAEAKYWTAFAWHIRGNDSYSQADPVALRVFGERLQRAEQVLKDAKDYSMDNPLWYEAYLDIAVAASRDDHFIQALFDEAIHRHPYFTPLYLDMAKHWAPRSGKKVDWGKADEVIRQAAANTANIDGLSNYAMLYVQLGALQKCECNLLEDSRVSWDKMRDSFADLVKRYPSVDNLNEFAAFACRANDQQTFLNIRPRIVDRIVPNKWLNGYSSDLCDHRFMQNS